MTHVNGDVYCSANSRMPFIPSLLPEGRKLGRWDVGGAQPTLSGPILHNGVLLWSYYREKGAGGSPGFGGFPPLARLVAAPGTHAALL
jgi:hypothetical protein